jgi:hypothetical protein
MPFSFLWVGSYLASAFLAADAEKQRRSDSDISEKNFVVPWRNRCSCWRMKSNQDTAFLC